MEIKKLYSFSNKKQIWRLLPANPNKLIIEERDPELKEAFFSCIDISSGKKIFSGLSIEEKFWIGIEKIYKDIIFFHKFKKPDMPGHRGIVAFDILKKEILWKSEELIFLFVYNDEVFCYKESSSGGESRNYLKLNYLTGEIIKNFGNDPSELMGLKDQVLKEDEYKNYHFTQKFVPEAEIDERVKNILIQERNSNLISGKIDYIFINDILLLSYHEILSDGKEMRNIFKAVDIVRGKVILENELNRGVKNFIPDSFFIKDNFLFLLKEKTELLVYALE